jgi:hypothetical protein
MTNPQNTSECKNSGEGVRHTTVTPLLDLDNWVGDNNKMSPCGNFIFHRTSPLKVGLYSRKRSFTHCENIDDRVGTDKTQLIKNLLNKHPFLATSLYTLLFIGKK